jgi:hypothetical protein
LSFVELQNPERERDYREKQVLGRFRFIWPKDARQRSPMSSLSLLAAPREYYLALQLKGFTYDSACRTPRLHARRCAAPRGLPTKIRAPHTGKLLFFVCVMQRAYFHRGPAKGYR